MNKKIVFSLFMVVLLVGFIGFALSEGETKTIETGTTENIGNLIGAGLEATDITANGVELTKTENENTLTFLEGGSVNIEGNKFENVKEDSLIKLDNNGLITFANLTVTKDTNFNFDGRTYKVLSGQNIIYKKEGENSIFTGNFQVGNDKFNGINKEDFASVTFSKDGKVSEIGKGTDAFVNGVNFKVTGNNLNLYYDENFKSIDHNGQNYFNFGNGKVSTGGIGFSFDLGKTNSVFGSMVAKKDVKGIGTKTRNLGFTLNGGNLEISKDTNVKSDLAFNVNGIGDYVINDGRAVVYSQKGYVKDENGRYVSSDKNSIFVKENYNNGLSYSYDINLNQGEYSLKSNVFTEQTLAQLQKK